MTYVTAPLYRPPPVGSDDPILCTLLQFFSEQELRDMPGSTLLTLVRATERGLKERRPAALMEFMDDLYEWYALGHPHVRTVGA